MSEKDVWTLFFVFPILKKKKGKTMTVRSVLGHADSTRAPDSVPTVAVSSYLRKAWLPSPPPSFPFPCASPAQCQGGPKYHLFFRILIFETAFLFPKLSSASSVLTAERGSGAFGSVLTHGCYLSSWMKVNKSQCFTLCTVTHFLLLSFFFFFKCLCIETVMSKMGLWA